jgi:hypothetical protein
MTQTPVNLHRPAAAEKFLKALQKTDEIDLTVTGRVSGRNSARPVWFVHEGKEIYLLPVQGCDTEWYKNILKNPTITLSAEGATLTLQVKPIIDPARVREVVEKFRAKYGAGEVKKYYSKFDVAAEVELS